MSSVPIPVPITVPIHVVPAGALAAGHGVARYAAETAATVGAPVVDLTDIEALPPSRLHVHVTDRILGASPEAAAAWLSAIAARHEVTVTLHDVPQDSDGGGFARRARAYADMLGATRAWAVSSHHEAALVQAHLRPATSGVVVPLPVPARVRRPGGTRGGARGGVPVVGLVGWIYPGKGHAEAITAAGVVARGLGRPVVVRALGGASAGHEDLVGSLDREAADADGDVRFEATGYLDEDAFDAAIAAVDVPVAAHRHLSASGSINSWIGAGRRPLTTDGAYAREMAALRPGTLQVVADRPGALAEAIAAAVSDPEATWLPDDVDLRPGPAETAAAYRAWWARVWGAGR